MSIFLQSTVSHFREPKLAFDDAELVLDFGPDTRLVSITGTLLFAKLPLAAALGVRESLARGA